MADFETLTLCSFVNSNQMCTQSQKTQGFCVADFATLSDERRSRSKLFPLFIWIKEACVRKFEGLDVRNVLGFRKLYLFLQGLSYKVSFVLGKKLFSNATIIRFQIEFVTHTMLLWA